MIEAEQASRYFETRLAGQKFNGKAEQTVRCPFHEDRTASLAINRDKGVWQCHAGCGGGGVLDFEEKFSHCDRSTAVQNVNALIGAAVFGGNGRQHVATYRYTDTRGKLVFEKVRYSPKDFAYRRPGENGSWIWNLDGIQKPLYRLPELISAKDVVITEGEKDSDNLSAALRTIDLKGEPVAVTTNVDGAGAGKWCSHYSPFFAGKDVVILPDNDDAGRARAEEIAASIYPYAAGIKVVMLSDLPEKGDVSDYLESHSVQDLIAEVKKQTRAWSPPASTAVQQQTTTKFDGPELIVIRGDAVSEKSLRWVWKPYLPLGKLVHFGGNSSQAKSPVTVDLAARISAGAPWPDGTENTQGPRSVILLNIEDDLEDTILPRFRLAGGDKSKLYYVKGTRIAVSDSDPIERLVTLEADMQNIVKLARGVPDLGLIVIDPVTNYLGSKKYIDESDMRSILTPLAALAAERGIVVITVGHFNRREKGTDPLHRMMGAAAFSGVARAVYAFGPDPDEESKFAHVMTVVRACGGEGSALRYHTELVTENCPDCEPNEIVKVVWDGQSDATAEDSVDPTPSKDKSQEDEAAQLLKELLREGKRSASDCHQALKADGYDLDKLNAGRVRRKARAESKKFPGDRFNSWYLPEYTAHSA